MKLVHDFRHDTFEERIVKKLFLSAVATAALVGAGTSPAEAKGCVRGAVAGAVAGHIAHHHAVAGALGGCVAGHYYYKHKKAKAVAHPTHKPG